MRPDAMNDAELAAMAQRLIEVVRYETAVAIGVHLKEVEAASLRLRNIAASIKLNKSQFISDIEASGIQSTGAGHVPLVEIRKTCAQEIFRSVSIEQLWIRVKTFADSNERHTFKHTQTSNASPAESLIMVACCSLLWSISLRLFVAPR